MNPQSEPSLDDSVKKIMDTLPPPVRQYLTQGKYSAVAGRLTTKYGLHIDQGGVLERELMLLLMGIETPDEFTQALAEEAKIGSEVIRGIVQEINTQIFSPLQEEMRKGFEMLKQQSQRPQPQAGTPRYFHLENKIAPVLQRPVSSEKLLEDHEEPHIEFNKTAPPPPNLPGAILPVVPPQPKPVPSRPYSIDPYREPIE